MHSNDFAASIGAIQVLRGRPTDEELAAVDAALQLVFRSQAEKDAMRPHARPGWRRPDFWSRQNCGAARWGPGPRISIAPHRSSASRAYPEFRRAPTNCRCRHSIAVSRRAKSMP
jgi:hypothetical protein